MRTAIAILALFCGVAFVPQAPTAGVLKGHFASGGPRYQYLPFEVPAGTESLTISYTYTGNDGASLIDLGLFEPGPTTLGSASFRGYSGGAQQTITVGRNHSSPGYKTGPLPAGTWHVMLGMYRVAATGVDVQVTITQGPDEALPNQPGPGLQPAARGNHAASPRAKAAWYSGALHLHTRHSDGALTPAALADAAREAGYDFIAITDHNNTTHTREPLPSSPLHIDGEEITTPAGHATVVGLPNGAWIDFRVSPHDPHAAEDIAGMVAQAHTAGALFIISHPVDACGGCSWDQAVPDTIDAVEIWQNEPAPRDGEIAFWDRLLHMGRHVTAVGVSDWHRPATRIDMAAVRVFADSLTPSAILDGIRRGHVIVVRDAKTEAPKVRATCGSQTAGVGDTLTCSATDTLTMHVDAGGVHDGDVAFIWNAARMTSKVLDGGATFSMPAARGYLRAHLYAADHTAIAITNPVYVEIR